MKIVHLNYSEVRLKELRMLPTVEFESGYIRVGNFLTTYAVQLHFG